MKILGVLLVGLCACASAQTYTAGKLEFLNRGPFSAAQLEAVAGIHPGMKITTDDLSASAGRLADSGYIDDVTATLDGNINAITVIYKLKLAPSEGMLPVVFQNFVWLTPSEIDAAVQSKLPLFDDYLPEGSANQETVRTALTEALAAKGVQASVIYETAEPTLEHPVRVIAFHVSKPFVRVAEVKLAGVTTTLVPFIQKSVNGVANKPYIGAPEGLTTADQILMPLLDSGYVSAALSGVQVTPSAEQNGTAGVVVSATLDPKGVYKVSEIDFAGCPLLSAADFAANAKLHPGDVASRSALLETLKPIDDAYRKQGYMDVTVEAKPTLKEDTHEVAYTVSVNPGEQYRVGELTTENLDPAAQAAFDKVFQMKKGALYNPDYLSGFIKNNNSVKELVPYSGHFVASAHPKTHTVDVDVTFVHR